MRESSSRILLGRCYWFLFCFSKSTLIDFKKWVRGDVWDMADGKITIIVVVEVLKVAKSVDFS
jgi:hypothetical protein